MPLKALTCYFEANQFNLSKKSQGLAINFPIGGILANRTLTTKDGLADIQFLIVELEKKEPDTKIIKCLTTKYGIPYKTNISEQLDEILFFLNSFAISKELEQEP